ncbi:MAG TPA: glycosyltransferase family 87 protein [Candidatus Limnocylindrales bacterium]
MTTRLASQRIRSWSPGSVWGLRAFRNDRFAVAVFALLAVLAALRNFPSPEWISVELRNYGWALNRLVTGQHMYFVPLPNNPSNPLAHYTPPPFTPLLGGQFTNTPIAWGIINLSAMAAGILFAAAASGAVSGRRPLPAIVVAVLVAALFGPAMTVLLLGNQQGFVVLALGAGWWLERRGRPGTSGVALVAGGLVKLFPGLVLVRSAARAEWRVLIAALASATVLIVVSAYLLGPHRYINFLRSLLEGAQPAFGRDFNLAPASLLGSIPASAVLILLGAVVIWWSARRDTAAVSFARAIVVALVVWPVSWYEYASVVLVAAAVTFDRRTWRWLASALFLFSIANPLAWLAGAAVAWVGAGRFQEATEPEASGNSAVPASSVADERSMTPGWSTPDGAEAGI